MPDYRRYRTPGGCYFFTVNLLKRGENDLLVRYIDNLRLSVQTTRRKWPFHINAWVVLPNHLHCVWTLPPGDIDNANRWRLIKQNFRCLDRKLSDSECRPNSPWKRTGAGRVFMENLQGLPIARRVIREQEVPPSSDVDGQGAAGIKPCRCRPILGQGRTKIFTVGIRHSLLQKPCNHRKTFNC
jgi:putative transposase